MPTKRRRPAKPATLPALTPDMQTAVLQPLFAYVCQPHTLLHAPAHIRPVERDATSVCIQVNLCTLNAFGAMCVLLNRGIREQVYQCMLAAAPQYHLSVLRC